MPKYANVILPLPLRKTPSYVIPHEMTDRILIGQRVEVQFGAKKRYTGIVYSIHEEYNSLVKPKSILGILEDQPIIRHAQLDVWEWMSQYYSCTLGEIMQAALPSSLKLQNETLVILNGDYRPDEWTHNDAENLIIEALIHHQQMSLEQIDDLVKNYNVYPIIKSLLDKEIVLVKERLKEEPSAKTRTWVHLKAPFNESDDHFLLAMELAARSEKQSRVLLSLYELRKKGPVEKKVLQKKSRADHGVFKALIKKEIIELEERPFYELLTNEGAHDIILSEDQKKALNQLETALDEQKPVLLHGVTGSGKTHLYIERIQKVIDDGRQALFLLPEIALTTQVITRLQEVFGEQVVAYHSRLNDRERAAVWRAVFNGHPIVLGARSSLFLPFKDLGLIVVDEEHDGSYKQRDPAPRYQARDLAIFMQHRHKVDVILGSATPSLESQMNVVVGKYQKVELASRFGDLKLPDIELVDLKKYGRPQNLKAGFADPVIDKIRQTVDGGEQVLIFQNRRGYSPIAQCMTCAWHAECPNCDVSLTYHKVFKNLRCHYCGHRDGLPHACPQCGSPHINYKGFGTERIEDDLKAFFPDYRIARMDYDTAGGKKSRERLIERMEEQELDILVGTQMITKGLDFDHIGLVVVVSADQLLFQPNFRTNERAYQMLTQVSGRAGRKKEGSEVMIQAYDVEHPVLKTLIDLKEVEFYQNEMKERKDFIYPPYFKLIQIEAKHKKPETLRAGVHELVTRLRKKWGERIVGPAEPMVARVRGLYIREILIKLERNGAVINEVKKHLTTSIDEVHKLSGLSGVRFNVNVDP